MTVFQIWLTCCIDCTVNNHFKPLAMLCKRFISMLYIKYFSKPRNSLKLFYNITSIKGNQYCSFISKNSTDK
jgi:hypothetical protein